MTTIDQGHLCGDRIGGEEIMENKNVKVLMFGWELPPNNSGGLGVARFGLTKGLAARGIGVSFALPKTLETNIKFMEILDHHIHGVDFTAINSTMRAYQTQRDYCNRFDRAWVDEGDMYGLSLYDEAIRFAQIAQSWSKTKYHNLIHAHDWMTYPAGISAKRISGKPFVAHVHATEYDRTGGNVDPRIAEIEYQGLTHADSVIAVSDYTRHVVHDKYSVPLNKIAVVHNGIDSNEFTPENIRRVFPHDKIVLYVGRLTFQKGVEYFLKSAKQVLAREPNTVFIVAGTGDMERHLIMQAAFLGIGNRVIFTGHMNGERLQTLYRMSDVFVMPSVSEPYGIVALEAVASGVPTIISKQSGVSETLKNVHKVDFWNTNKISDYIVHIFNNPEIASQKAQYAQAEARQLTWDKAAGNTITLYQSLL